MMQLVGVRVVGGFERSRWESGGVGRGERSSEGRLEARWFNVFADFGVEVAGFDIIVF